MVFRIVRKDFKCRLKDPFSLILLLAFPLVLTLIISLAMDYQAETMLPTTELLIADHDCDWLSRFMICMLKQGFEGAPGFTVRDVTEKEGRKAISGGRGTAMLVFPTDFTQDCLLGKQTRLMLLKNPGQAFLPNIAEQYADILALLLSYSSRLLEDDWGKIKEFSNRLRSYQIIGSKADRAISWDLIYDELRSFDELSDYESYLFPVPIFVEETGPDGHKQDPEPKNGSYTGCVDKTLLLPYRKWYLIVFNYMFPGLALFGIYFVLSVALCDTFTEQSQNTMMRLLTTPVTVEAFVVGKMAGVFFLSLLGLILLQIVGSVAYGVRWGPFGLVFLVDLVAILGILGMCLLIFCLTRTPRCRMSLMSAIIMFMALFGGSLVPLHKLPPFITKMSLFTLNGHLLPAYHSLIYRGTLSSMTFRLAGVAIFGALSSALGMLLLRHRIRKGC